MLLNDIAPALALDDLRFRLWRVAEVSLSFVFAQRHVVARWGMRCAVMYASDPSIIRPNLATVFAYRGASWGIDLPTSSPRVMHAIAIPEKQHQKFETLRNARLKIPDLAMAVVGQDVYTINLHG